MSSAEISDERKGGKKVDVVTIESITQTDIPSWKNGSKSINKVISLLSAQFQKKGKEKSELAQTSPVEPKRYQTSKTRVITRGQRLQVSKRWDPPS